MVGAHDLEISIRVEKRKTMERDYFFEVWLVAISFVGVW